MNRDNDDFSDGLLDDCPHQHRLPEIEIMITSQIRLSPKPSRSNLLRLANRQLDDFKREIPHRGVLDSVQTPTKRLNGIHLVIPFFVRVSSGPPQIAAVDPPST
jgi:hypothetical protein